MPDHRILAGHPSKGGGIRRRPKAEAPAAAEAEAEAQAAPRAKAPDGPAAAGLASFEALFGQRYQASKLSESDTLARLAGAAIGRLPGLEAQGPLAAQVAAGRLDQEGVRLLQAALNASGAKLSEDGQYGPRTHAALSKALKSAPAARPQRVGRAKPKGEASPPALAKPQQEAAPPAPKAKPKAAEGPAAEAPGRRPSKAGPGVASLPEATPQPERGAAEAATGRQASGLGASLEGRTLKRTSGRATTFANGHIPYKGWVDVHNKQHRGIGAWGDKCAPTEYFCALPDALGLGIQAAKWWHNKKILVTNPENGKQVVVRIQDKGPHGKTGAAIDLSPVATEALGGALGGSISHVTFQFAHQDATVGPVR